MNKDQQINNILAFFSIVFGEDDKAWHLSVMKLTLDYLIEKFNRYILSSRYEASWGIHPALRQSRLDQYCAKWNIPTGDDLID